MPFSNLLVAGSSPACPPEGPQLSGPSLHGPAVGTVCRLSESLLQVNVDVADLGVGVEFEHGHRVHDMRVVTEEMPFFDLEIDELWQLGDAPHGCFERID